MGTYGELLQKAKNAVRFLYNGSYGVVTDENGLYYMRARYYNPDIKRFLNQDIKVGDISNGQGLNRYAYCEGNPVSMVDPFGLSPQISQDQTSRFSVLHNILDLAGLAFDAADVINAAFYAAEGDWTNAALCAVAVIPIAGSAIAGAAKGTKAVVKAKKAEKILELAEESCKMTRNASDRLDVFSDVMKASSKWGNSPVKLMDGITAETGAKAIKALESGGDFGRESKRAVQELKAVVGAEGIHLKPSVSRKVDVFKDSFVKTEKKVKSGSNTKTLFRGDRASVVPDDVFQNGFKPKGTHNDALLHTKSNKTAGNFVSTSGDKAIATEFAGKNGYVYVIQTDNYVDINSTYGADAYFPEQMEFSIPGGIKPSEIVGVYKKQGGKIIGDFIPNPNFGGN